MGEIYYSQGVKVTRKDFEAIAHILRLRVEDPDIYDRLTVSSVATAMASYLSTTHPRFDTGRFMRSCGL